MIKRNKSKKNLLKKNKKYLNHSGLLPFNNFFSNITVNKKSLILNSNINNKNTNFINSKLFLKKKINLGKSMDLNSIKINQTPVKIKKLKPDNIRKKLKNNITKNEKTTIKKQLSMKINNSNNVKKLLNNINNSNLKYKSQLNKKKIDYNKNFKKNSKNLREKLSENLN